MEFPDADEWEFVNIDYKNPARLVERQHSDTWTEISHLKPRPQFYKSFAEIASQKPVFEAAKKQQVPSKVKPRRQMKTQQAEGATEQSSDVGETIGKQLPKRFKKHLPRKISSEIKRNNRKNSTRR